MADDLPGRRPDLTPCYWGSVNQWECDENDHLNVRYYAHKMNQALQIFVAGLGAAHPEALGAGIRAQQIRFLQESRSAAPLRIDCGITSRDGRHLELLSVMHHNTSGDALAAFVSRVDAGNLGLPEAPAGTAATPDYAGPRGIDPDALPAPPATLEDARAAGFHTVGRGVIGADECDASGQLLPHVYIGRISDGMPNLWSFLNTEVDHEARENGDLGGAALEQLLRIHAPLTAGAVFSQLSGVRSLGNKTQQMAHLLYDETHGRLAASAEAVGVAMDLTTRRAVPISPERRARLEALLLKIP